MGGKKLLLGFVVLSAIMFGAIGVSACNGGGGEVFNGSMFYQDIFLTDGTNTVPFEGILNIDNPFLDPELTDGMDVVVIRNAFIKVIDITPDIENLNYMDYESADVLPRIMPEPPVCDEMFGYMRYIDEANIIACTYPTNCPQVVAVKAIAE